MIAVDTNILVYAHRQDSPWHEAAKQKLTSLAEGRASWAIPWSCLHEFLAIVTHPRIYDPPTPRPAALSQIEAWMESPGLVLIGEDDGYWEIVRKLIDEGKVAGAKVHDARIAAVCLLHGVGELWSADRDFGKFAALNVLNPLVS